MRKHAPGRRCTVASLSFCRLLFVCGADAFLAGFALAAETEASIYLLQQIPRSTSATAVDSYHASLTKLQEPLQAALDQCSNSPEQPPSFASAGVGVGVLTLEDVLLARTVLAWIFSLKRDWAATLEVVPTENDLNGERSGGSGGTGYFEITRIKALVLRGSYSPPVGF